MTTSSSGSPRWIPEAPTAAIRRDHPSRFLPWLRDRNPLFAPLPEAAARLLFELSTWRIEPRSCVLAAADQPSVQAFIVIDGVVVQRVTRGPRTRELGSHGPGQVAGAIAFLDQRPAPFELASHGPAQLIVVDAFKVAQMAAAFQPDATALLWALAPLWTNYHRDLVHRMGQLRQRVTVSEQVLL
jgi:CRP-like cAMP-binding protein